MSTYRNLFIYLSALFIATVAAFWPVYFARLSEVKTAIHVHTLLGILWLLLMIAQAYLIRQKKIQQHRTIGRISYFIVPAFTLSNLLLFRDFVNMDSEFERMFGAQITFYDLTGLLLFVVLFTLAVTKYRRNINIHSRLMVASLSFLLFPIISRLFLFYASLGLGVTDILLTGIYSTELLYLALVIHDWRNGKIYFVYPLVLGYVTIQHIGFLYSKEWQWWHEFITWYASI
jgi:hypothetical protein